MDNLRSLSPEEIISDKRIALIDIGSNSIRLVIYRAGGRLPHPQFNEREVCRLGEGVNEHGVLAKDRIDHAMETLSRFAMIFRNSEVERLEVFATEAVRRASNKMDFLAPAESLLGVPIRILKGSEEAMLSAKGVLSGFVEVNGVVGDIGGGSLEMLNIVPGQDLREAKNGSLQLGHLLDLPEKVIHAELVKLGWLAEEKGGTFYAVGGVWRALATAYASLRKNRVDIVHGLCLEADQLLSLMEKVDAAEGIIKGIPPARYGSMRQGNRVMRSIIKVMKPEKIIFSSYGLREGILFDQLDSAIAGIDPLIAGVAEYGSMSYRFENLGPVLASSLDPLLVDLPPTLGRLARASCYLADLCWLEHPDYRGILAIDKMLGLSVVGIEHSERVWMAAVLYIRYTGKFPKRSLFKGMLSRKERKSARFIGLTLRMMMTISGGIPAIIRKIGIVSRQKTISIAFPVATMGKQSMLYARRVEAMQEYSTRKIEIIPREED
ncbi:hypothetical protein AB8880_07035 [Alphaproteobacteria bacterium LSUCC0684]